MKNEHNVQADPIDEDAQANHNTDSIEPMMLSKHGRTNSQATTIRPDTAGSDPFATPHERSRSSTLATMKGHGVNAAEALTPDPGTEAEFKVENNPFAFSPGQLGKMLNPKSLEAYQALGGLKGIERGLQTSITSGLNVDETTVANGITFAQATGDLQKKPEMAPHRSTGTGAFTDRSRVYSTNVLPSKSATPLYKLMWAAYQEKVLIVLTVAAVISLALGIYETVGAEHEPDAPTPVDWVEGLAICAAIIIVVVVGGLNDWQKERAFVKLNAKKDDREVKVMRSGKTFMMNVAELLVGDVVHMEPGDIIPADGIFISGHEVKCDESSATGESDALLKTPGEQVMRMLESGTKAKDKLDPFVISGAKVLEGVGTFLVTSVGTHSSFGKIMMSIRTTVDPTPLQTKLAGLAVRISQWAVSAASFLFFVLLFRFLANLGSDDRSPAEKASFFMEIFIVAITVIVVAVPEGLPLAVTLALAFATTRLLKENNLVRVLRSCETMGNATTVCSDKTGTLTTNKMTVVAGSFGNTKFAKSESMQAGAQSTTQWAANVKQPAKDLLIQSVAINSTAFEGQEDGVACFVGSKTETALLQFAKDHLAMPAVATVRDNQKPVQIYPFDSSKKCMAAVIRLPGGGYRLLVKGASEILLSYCNSKSDIHTLEESQLSASDNISVRSCIDTYARQSLRTIGLVYRDFAQWPPTHLHASEDGHVQLSALLKDLVFIGLVGIQDPVRPGVPEAVESARKAGVKIRMVTGDNIVTAEAIAKECGICTVGGVIMEGPEFRKMSDDEMTRVVPKLDVLARSSPEDKRILVMKLKSMGETVAVTGDGTNDAPALKAADVGFSMGISGTEVAKEASQIVLMDDNFKSIIVALKWGRAVNDSVQKFLQFQITVSITAVILAFVSSITHPEMKSVLTAIQLLWVNLFMDTFAGIVLATDPPTDRILDRPPQKKSAPLITLNMWKMIIGQTIFQLAVTVTLHFVSGKLFGYDPNNEHRQLQLDSMIFNTFVWLQIFNELNCRRLDNGFNMFTGLIRNPYFIGINLFMVGCQIAIMFVGGKVFSVTGMTGTQWAISVAIPSLSLPWAILVRMFPDETFGKIVAFVTWPFVKLYAVIFAPLGRFIAKMRGKKVQQGETGADREKGRS